MQCKQFYIELKKIFNERDLDFNWFLNPKLQHAHFSDVQFVYSSGAICPPWKPNAKNIYFADPLSGPFYNMKIAGLSLEELNLAEGWNGVRVIVILPNNKLAASSIIPIRSPINKIKEKLGILVNNKWYIIKEQDNIVDITPHEPNISNGRI